MIAVFLVFQGRTCFLERHLEDVVVLANGHVFKPVLRDLLDELFHGLYSGLHLDDVEDASFSQNAVRLQ